MTNKFDTPSCRQDYKVPSGRNYGCNEKTIISFGGIYFAKQEKIMTKHKAGVQVVIKL